MKGCLSRVGSRIHVGPVRDEQFSDRLITIDGRHVERRESPNGRPLVDVRTLSDEPLGSRNRLFRTEMA